MSGKSKSRFSARARHVIDCVMSGKSKSRASKRKNEMESSSTVEPKSKRISKESESEQMFDKYCWLCHTEANDKMCCICPRTYHNGCLDKASASFSELGACPECQFKSVDGTELNSNRFLSENKLKKTLDVLTRRSFDKKREKNEIFLCWPEEDRDNLYKIIDLEILLDNINQLVHYTGTAQFYADVKFIYHNACIVYGVNSDEAKTAENLRRDFKAELVDLEACPECYYYLYCDENDRQDPFVRLCSSPHDIVWAQLTGHPFWPAKCLKVVKGISHVRFFGEHEQANIPISKCLFLSESHPKDKNSKLTSLTNSGPKSQRYKSAKAELLEYIHLYRRKYGDFPFYPHKTAYKAPEKKKEVVKPSTEGSCNRILVQMKSEANANEDSEMCNYAERPMDSEETNSVTDDSRHPIGFGTEGQYPTLAQINPSIDPSSSPCQGSETESQYPTFAHLNPSFDPSLSHSQDNMNKNKSAVASIDMTFSAEDNIDNANSGGTSTAFLPLTDSASNVLSSSSANDTTEKVKGPFHRSDPTGTETVYSTNNPSEDSPVLPDSLHNIWNNLPDCIENQTDLDEDILYLGQQIAEEIGENFNPNLVLPILMEKNPELRSYIQKARYLTDALTLKFYSNFATKSEGKMSQICVSLRKTRDELKKALEAKDTMSKENELYRCTILDLNRTVEKLVSEVKILQGKHTDAATNAKFLINGIKAKCLKTMEEQIKSQYVASINEKEDCILKKDKQLQEAEEEIRRLKRELEEVGRQRAEEKLKAPKSQIPPDTLSEYKRTHYCCVCERSAAIVCCLNTSYCSPECQAINFKEHKSNCRSQITSQSFVKERVINRQLLTMSHGIFTSGRPNSEISETESTTGSTYHEEPETSGVSTSRLHPTPHYRSTASSSRSCSSRSKRHR